MNEYVTEQINKFFEGIAPWRNAYSYARLNYLAVKKDGELLILSARIYLEIKPNAQPLPIFSAGNILASHWDIPLNKFKVEDVLAALISHEGFYIEGHGQLRLAADSDNSIIASTPMLLHQEGISSGNRLSVLSISGAQRHNYLPQPETDWLLKAGSVPFDNLNELTLQYGLGTLRGDYAILEVVATNSIQIYSNSSVKNDNASLGIWMASSLNKSKAHIGYRVINNGNVVLRDITIGEKLIWVDEIDVSIGTMEIKVPIGSFIQCFACYEGQAHQSQWILDPEIFQNPRFSVISFVDSTGQLLRNYLFPDLPPKNKAADDFEAAISWTIWALGFAPANFGLNNKTRDAFDTVAVTPNGNFVIIECTLGLLRAESKLSKLVARACSLRELLDKSNMKHLRILPVIITAMTLEQVKADVSQAEDTGILVLTKEDLEQITDELLRFPNADNLFEKGMQKVIENSKKTKDLFPTLSHLN